MAKSFKDKGIAAFARAIERSEATVRRLDALGIVRPARDQWGRRLFGPDDEVAARRYLENHRPHVPRTRVAAIEG